jgi:hypothetical protein
MMQFWERKNPRHRHPGAVNPGVKQYKRKMIHPLWQKCRELNSTAPLDSASDETLIAMLFQSPQHPDPLVMGWFRRNRFDVVRRYQALFYGGHIPSFAKSRKPHNN